MSDTVGTEWQRVAEGMDVVPIWCQQPGCTRAVETWCPLCEMFLCQVHDELTPARRHNCLGGPADEGAA